MKTAGWTCVLALSAAAVVAEGQVVPSQNGRALDSSFLIGSGGYSIRQAYRAVDGNLFVTGQVRRGFGFHGDVGYVGADQLRTTLGSAGMDAFTRDSVGLGQVFSGNLYGPATYLSRYRTALGSGAIAAGMNAPGSSLPRTTAVPPLAARRLLDAAVKAYQPLQPRPGESMRVSGALPSVSPLLKPLEVGSVPTGRERVSGAYRPATSALFGLLRAQDRQQLAEELTEDELIRRLWSQRPGADEEPQPEGEQQPAVPSGSPGQGGAPAPAEVAPEQGAAQEEGLPARGQDVFLDMLVQMRQMSERARRRSQEIADEQDPNMPRRRTAPPTVRLPQTPEQVRAQRLQQVRQAVEELRGQVILHHLAGASRDQFNLRMRRAEAALKQGKFYEAAKHYKVAVVLWRENPLAWTGLSLALFGADEPVSSALALRKAMQRFPPLMDTQVDIRSLLGADVVADRLRRLERRLNKPGGEGDPAMTFLAAFVHSALGDTEKARAYARTLKDLPGASDVQRNYALRLLTGGTATKPAPAREAP